MCAKHMETYDKASACCLEREEEEALSPLISHIELSHIELSHIELSHIELSHIELSHIELSHM